MSTIKYHPEVEKLEHDDSIAPETKRVLLYGWDSNNLQKVRLATNANGELQIDPTNLDSRYLKLDASNDPITGSLTFSPGSSVSVGAPVLNTNYSIEAYSVRNETSGENRALSFYIAGNPSSSSSNSLLGLNGFSEHISSSGSTGAYFGGFFGSRLASTATMSVMYGGFAEVQSTQAGNISFAVGNVGSINDSGGTDYSTAYGLWSLGGVTSGGSISTFHGLHISSTYGTGSVTDNSAIYIENQTKGSSNLAIEISGTGTGNAIEFGGDTNLYRTFANSLATDDGIHFTQDNAHIYMGAGFDLDFYHNGTNSIIAGYTGELQIDGNSGSGVKLIGKIGFYGTTPISRQVLSTGSGATVDNVITALQNLGLVSQT